MLAASASGDAAQQRLIQITNLAIVCPSFPVNLGKIDIAEGGWINCR